MEPFLFGKDLNVVRWKRWESIWIATFTDGFREESDRLFGNMDESSTADFGLFLHCGRDAVAVTHVEIERKVERFDMKASTIALFSIQ